MESSLEQVLIETPELDSELLDDKSQVIGVAAVTEDGSCLTSKGQLDDSFVSLTSSLTKIAEGFEESKTENPIIIVDTEEMKILIKKEHDLSLVILKNTVNGDFKDQMGGENEL